MYDYLEPYGRICVAGRVGDVGAALSIGGRLSHFSNKYGLVADNIVSFKIVLANGDIVTTSATSKPDLFFAVKGGANNFGKSMHADFVAFIENTNHNYRNRHSCYHEDLPEWKGVGRCHHL